ncbi:hypothetical protein BJX68DRAFT_162674 [Aspergillus pseudodeflectus]|uniref:Zn(2)-C6 fungal-type domain-containing protein n=1 Tax=Aspergillus pseudodeflectus TaxID=176178 RepID=A0ABR4L0Z0_9EURO
MCTPLGPTWADTSLSVLAPKPLPSSSSSDSSTPPNYAVLKPKSCLACRKRKVKCDRQLPCGNCSRWTIECIFPSPIRRCPRARTKTGATRSRGDQALQDRIHMLEAQVSELTETVSAQAERLRQVTTPGGSMFAFSHTWAHSVAPLNPSLALGQTYWQVFLERVDPLIKVVHRPSASRILRSAIDNPTLLNEGQGALLQVIYLACISAMDEADIQANLQMSKATAVSTYRMAAEHALARAGFLTTNDWNTMQALVLFIALSRLQNNHRSAWTLAGLAERLDISLEEDSSRFGAEMRRRLRWHMWYLNRRIQDDRGSNPNISPVGVDLPLNCRDTELSQTMTIQPNVQHGWTEVSFCLLRYDLATTERIVESDAPWLIKTKAVRECQHRLHTKYLAYCDGSEPIHWLACHISYVMITEMWMKLFSPQFFASSSPSSLDSEATSAHAVRDQLFDAAVDILDTQKRLEKEIAARNWEWTLSGYFQYVPLAFLLNELRWRRSDPRTDRAWEVAERSFGRWSEEAKRSVHGVMLTELMSSVLVARQQASEFQSIADSYLVPDERVFDDAGGVSGLGQDDVWPDLLPEDMFQFGLPVEWVYQVQ